MGGGGFTAAKRIELIYSGLPQLGDCRTLFSYILDLHIRVSYRTQNIYWVKSDAKSVWYRTIQKRLTFED